MVKTEGWARTRSGAFWNSSPRPFGIGIPARTCVRRPTLRPVLGLPDSLRGGAAPFAATREPADFATCS